MQGCPTVWLATAFFLCSSALFALAAPSSAEPPAPGDPVLPATGQTTSYASQPLGATEPVDVPDDGRVQAGAPLRFEDNGDGTISDLTTGLMWEKKCEGCGGLHDVNLRLRWSAVGNQPSIWEWLEEINAEDGTGFAGHDDWRIPNVKELIAIIDYGRRDPALAEIFSRAICDDGCDDVTSTTCSCTANANYWTSTTFSDFPAHAYIVHVPAGFVDDRVKTLPLHVRAVRGGAIAAPAAEP